MFAVYLPFQVMTKVSVLVLFNLINISKPHLHVLGEPGVTIVLDCTSIYFFFIF